MWRILKDQQEEEGRRGHSGIGYVVGGGEEEGTSVTSSHIICTIYTHTHARTHAHTHARTHAHTHTHARTHTRTHTHRLWR